MQIIERVTNAVGKQPISIQDVACCKAYSDNMQQSGCNHKIGAVGNHTL